MHVSLVMRKSRIAPTKITTIPRLELTAAVVSAKVAKMVQEELNFLNVSALLSRRVMRIMSIGGHYTDLQLYPVLLKAVCTVLITCNMKSLI